MLKPGDPCPCCGQPIKTSDPVILAILTRIREEMPFTIETEAVKECMPT